MGYPEKRRGEKMMAKNLKNTFGKINFIDAERTCFRLHVSKKEHETICEKGKRNINKFVIKFDLIQFCTRTD